MNDMKIFAHVMTRWLAFLNDNRDNRDNFYLRIKKAGAVGRVLDCFFNQKIVPIVSIVFKKT